jgi:hypothetical protein
MIKKMFYGTVLAASLMTSPVIGASIEEMKLMNEKELLNEALHACNIETCRGGATIASSQSRDPRVEAAVIQPPLSRQPDGG